MVGLKMNVKVDELLYIYDNIIYKNSKHKDKLYNFEKNKMSILYDLCYRLNNNLYEMGRYNIFLIKYPKYRIIMSLSVTDKIVNHYVTLKYLIPNLSRFLDNRNVATRVNMGTDYGIKLIKKYLEENKKYNKFYVLKLDIKKYFYNIDHNVLKDMLKGYFDNNIYSLLCKIIDSTNEEYVNNKINNIKMKINIDKAKELPLCEYDKALPIGNMTSQFFAIYYLSSLDHFIVHDLHLKYYVRYMDDFVIIHHDKKYLEKVFLIISDMLNKMYKLELNDKSTIYDIDKGFDFLGYNYKIVNSKTIINVSRKSYKNIKKHINIYDSSVNYFNMYVNYYNSFKYCNNGFIRIYLDDYFGK